jgi:hypothetical protein
MASVKSIGLPVALKSGVGQRGSWCANKREPNGIVGALVGTVLWRGQTFQSNQANSIPQLPLSVGAIDVGSTR